MLFKFSLKRTHYCTILLFVLAHFIHFNIGPEQINYCKLLNGYFKCIAIIKDYQIDCVYNFGTLSYLNKNFLDFVLIFNLYDSAF